MINPCAKGHSRSYGECLQIQISLLKVWDCDITRSINLGMVQAEKIRDITLETEWKRQFRKKVSGILINSKITIAMLNTNELKKHAGGILHSLFVTACRVKWL